MLALIGVAATFFNLINHPLLGHIKNLVKRTGQLFDKDVGVVLVLHVF